MMRYYDILEITCPYCSNKFKKQFKLALNPYPQQVTVLCDIDETPGCDRRFLVEVQIKIDLLETYRLIPAN